MKRAALFFLFGLRCLAQSQGIAGIVAAGSAPELVQEGFTFTEGPVGTADGGLYFSDIREPSKTYQMHPDRRIMLFRETTKGTNGLALMKNGDLLGAEGDGKRISKRSR